MGRQAKLLHAIFHGNKLIMLIFCIFIFWNISMINCTTYFFILNIETILFHTTKFLICNTLVCKFILIRLFICCIKMSLGNKKKITRNGIHNNYILIIIHNFKSLSATPHFINLFSTFNYVMKICCSDTENIILL